ncbi:ribonuclease H-like domain protein [Vibrio phage 1.262.O._10N.286.51.A9]|nr:ribonuclease H-like domain protein [Vibrio phage 1.262.O._10N.286.51.A9]
MTENEIDKIIRMKKQGNTHRVIAKEVGRSPATVHTVLAKYFYPKQETVVDNKPKILIFDIETSPILAYCWGLFKQNIPIQAIKQDWQVLTWAGKWLGAGGVMFSTQANVSEEEVVRHLWHILDEADVVVAHNGARFDVKKMNAKFLEFGLGEPSPFKVVDTLHIVKARFALTSNKLDYIAKFLGGEGKMEHEGLKMWLDFMDGKEEAQQRMLDYNIQDVYELEEIYVELQGWNRRAPNLALYYNDGEHRCNICGGTHLNKVEGRSAYTNVSKFDLYRCGDCSGYVRGRKNTATRDNLNMNVT